MLDKEMIKKFNTYLDGEFGEGELVMHPKGSNGSGYLSNRGVFSQPDGKKLFVRIPDFRAGTRDFEVLNLLKDKVEVPEPYLLLIRADNNGETHIIEVMEYIDAPLLRDLIVNDYKEVLSGDPVEDTQLIPHIKVGLGAMKKLHDSTKTDVFGWSLNEDERKKELQYYNGSYTSRLTKEAEFMAEKFKQAGVDAEEYKTFMGILGRKIESLAQKGDHYSLIHGDSNTSNLFVKDNKGIIFDLDYSNFNSPFVDVEHFEKGLEWDFYSAKKNSGSPETSYPTKELFPQILGEVYGGNFAKEFDGVRDLFRYRSTSIIMGNSYSKPDIPERFYSGAKKMNDEVKKNLDNLV